MSESNEADRREAIALLHQDLAAAKVATTLHKSRSWAYKCQRLYRDGGMAALQEQSRRPHHCAKALPEAVHAAIRRARLELEHEAAQPQGLTYVGAHAIQARLRRQGTTPLPSVSTIEAELRRAGLTHVRQPAEQEEIDYPRLAPQRVHELVQVDIFPHYLPGGALVSCFNAIDTVSRYPTGMQLLHKSAADACAFLLHVWQEMGVPLYTQVDNESCFSGGFTHPNVLGQVVRLSLWAGTQLVFSPPYHPQSNGMVERFHQDYQIHTWAKQTFTTLDEVQARSPLFFSAYRTSAHHEALHGCTPLSLQQQPTVSLPALRPPKPLPLVSGHVHFMRAVDAHQQVHVLNVAWPVPGATPQQGVWVTLDLTPKGAALAVFDAAPTAHARRCLAVHPFPLREPVLPRQPPPPAPHQRRPFWLALYDVFKVLPVVKEHF